MTKIITIFNQAGGVGKTSLTMNLGYQLGQRKKQKVLLIDMDPQASLTIFMGIDPAELEVTVKDSILDKKDLPILNGIHGMDLVPANILLSAAEMQLSSVLRRELRLKQAIDKVANQYSFILIDSPPSLGMLSTLSLVAANYVLVPSQTQFKSIQGTNLVLQTIADVRDAIDHKLELAGVVPTIYAKGTLQDREALSVLESQLSAITKVYPPLPRSTAFPDASQERLPLAIFSPKHPGITILNQIVKDLEKLP
ncbi:AAA family ATPase [Leptolyngbya sp. FACHB-16]|uniref:AAA family ATPase n=1 Tax=unclassified Leptolyngbya TaxID=2650499 RepID=UPI001682AF36|nr:ParA family protein [Leptolyngbya sp. FACHB-16]